jgi:hypothetical protein
LVIPAVYRWFAADVEKEPVSRTREEGKR